jgi:hypothetical protein
MQFRWMVDALHDRQLGLTVASVEESHNDRDALTALLAQVLRIAE